MESITAITDAIDNGYVYAGIATTSTEPATGKVFYLTTATGVFTNFGGITVNTKGIKILKKVDSTWTSDTVIVMDDTPTENSTNLVKSGGVYASIASVLSKIAEGYLYAGIATPSTTPAAGKVFYLALTAGTYTNFNGLEVSQGINILKNNGSTWSLDSFVGIDDAPAPSSQKLVKSGGVFDEVMKNGSAFDLSAYNGGATYADLNAALTALNALPAAYKRGGMSMKFVLSSDNKYVQYRLMANTWSTVVANWQGVDDEPVAGSRNLIESNGVFQSNVVEGLIYVRNSNNFNYYSTPYIPFGGGSLTWTPSEINTDVFLTVYDASFNRVNQWKADSATISKTGQPSTVAYARASFLKDTRVGNLVLNGKKVWDNVSFNYNTYRDNATLLRYAGSLTSGYRFIDYISVGNTTPIVSPKAPCYYIAYPSTYTNFKDSNDVAINIPYDGNVYAIRSVFSNGELAYWEKVQLPITEASVNRRIQANTCSFGGIINTTSSPRKNNLHYPLFWYICLEPGTYTNFKKANNEPIVVPNDGTLYLIKEVESDGVRYYALTQTKSLVDNVNSVCWDYCGIANTTTVPKTPINENRQVFYICGTAGTYTNFSNITVNDNEICVLRSYYSSGTFTGWVKNTIKNISASEEQIESAVNQYFIDHPSSANQYVEFVTGANAYAILGPGQDGSDTRLCVGVGVSNMSSNTGEKNTAIGIQNMANATGDGNTAIGYHSLYRLTSGENNVGTGNEALDDNIEGSRNSGFGWGASKRNTNGNDNVSVGYCALHGDYSDGAYQNRPSFNRNTAIGSGAMRYVKTGSNDNVAIGYNATPEYNSSNQIVIGSGATGEKANQVVLGNMSVSDMVVGDKRLSFNNDGTVSWIQLYGVTYLYSRVSYSTNIPFVDKNSSFECYVTVASGYTLSTTSVKMGGVEVSSTAFDSTTGRIYIAQVTGTIRIEMRAIQV